MNVPAEQAGLGRTAMRCVPLAFMERAASKSVSVRMELIVMVSLANVPVLQDIR